MLENVYRDAYTGAEAIESSATFPAYGKPLLLALVLHVLTTKLNTLLERVLSATHDDGERKKLKEGIVALRDKVGEGADADRFKFILSFIEKVGRTMGLFRTGQVPTLPTRYLPITSSSVQELDADFAVQTSGLSEAAVAIAVLGLLAKNGVVNVNATDTTAFGAGVMEIESPVAPGKVFFAANGNAALRLRNNGFVNDSADTILIHSLEIIQPQTRSPRSAPGRIGKSGLREVSISSLIADTKTSDDLVQRFRREVGV